MHRTTWLLLAVLATTLLAEASFAREPRSRRRAAEATAERVELFAGLQDGRLRARFVAADAEQARLTIVNVADAPLTVELPSTFAGVPTSTRSGGESPQTLGAVIQPTSQGRLTSIDLLPGRRQELPVVCVCLEYGKPTPRPRDAFTIATVESVSDRAEVRTLLEELAEGRLDQAAAQLAAWHFNNGLTGEQLAATGFAPERMADAAKLVERVRATTAERQSAKRREAASEAE